VIDCFSKLILSSLLCLFFTFCYLFKIVNVKLGITGMLFLCVQVFQVPGDSSGIVSPRFSLEPSHSDGIQSLCITGSALFSGARDMGIMKWDIAEMPQLKQVCTDRLLM
jgi:hypothetical protein